MNYYFNVKATEKHDEEMAVIKARSLKQAKKEFASTFPEDINNIEHISSDKEMICE